MTHIQQRRDQAAVWAAENPVLFEGEAGHETDTGKWKLGDGVTAWNDLPYKAGVDSVAGKVGLVTLDVTDIADAAPLASPALTGSPTAPTPVITDNDTSIATTAFVKAVVAALVDSSPASLDTLNELAAALGDDPDFATTVLDALALKAPLADPTFTGNPSAPTPATSDNDTSIATTAFVKAVVAPMGVMQTWTPTITASSGAFTTVAATGRYTLIGDTVFWYATITITSDGTASNYIEMTMPPFDAMAAGHIAGHGRATIPSQSVTVQAFFITVDRIRISSYTDGQVIGDGYTVFLSGQYETPDAP